MINKCLEELSVNPLEYGFLLSDIFWCGAPEFQMVIPKIMPFFNIGDQQAQISDPYDNNIFVNDDACKPQTEGTMPTKNYITVPVFSNTRFNHKDPDKDGTIKSGERFIVAVMDGNIRDMYVTDNI